MGMLLAPRFLSNMAAYTLKNAALFDGATGYLSRTFGSAGGNTWTFSMWIARAKLSTEQHLITATGGEGLSLRPSDKLSVIDTVHNETTAVFRDTTSFMHVVLVGNGTLTKLYINNVLQTLSAAPNMVGMNGAVAHYLGRYSSALYYQNGYLAEVYFVDGQALTPADFGETDASTGNWIAKAYPGTYGTNGFHLDFADALNLGADASGNANTWTVTGGVSQVTSTPTNIFCTLNPIDISSVWNTPTTDGNLGTPGSNGTVCRTIGGTLFSEAPFYFEGSMISGTTYPNAHTYFGVGPVDTAGTSTLQPANSKGWFVSPWNAPLWGQVGLFALAVQSYFAHAYTASSVWMCAADPVNGRVWFGVDGGWFNLGDPVTGTNPTFTGLPALLKPYYGSYYSRTSTGLVYNFGASPFAFAAPTGFGTLSTDSLPARAPKTPATPQTGSFTGNANAEGPFINLGMAIDTAGVSTINGNVITWGTHADATAVGVKIRTALATYNAAGANTYSFAVKAYSGGANVAEATAQGNP